ncbi:MAG: multidrug efflux RND transporter permease subunit [Marinobacterium sp.]|nr:multidrug efflux RND transporter permease subunit [Marinobacterium sp.]
MSRYFIARPVFAWVVAISVMLAGLMALRSLPVSQYPDIAPPLVRVATSYPGASAQVVENSVTQILEQELKGLDRLLYFSSTSNATGDAEVMLTFEHGVDASAAQVQVQNLINQVSYRLPQPVQQSGVSVTTMQNSFLMVAVFYDESGRQSDRDIADWLSTSMVDALSRVPGVGAVRNFGAPYAMRIWLDPHRLNSFGLMPSDVIDAIEAQNNEVPVGELGARPSGDAQQLNISVTALSRLQTPQQFRDIVLKTGVNGAIVTLADVARVAIGSENYASTSRLNGKPASGMAIMLAPGANALATVAAVKERVEQLSRGFPDGIRVIYPEDASRFVKRAIRDVVQTLLEATVLVVVVMFLFLRNWRTTLIPAITVPVVLLGTFGILAALGYSINTLTLFGMVLAIGLLVDDAIVVVENVERIMAEQGLDARTATAQSMQEITSALIGITLVLAAVFLPMAFFAGSVGVIYRQFSITLVSAMVLSVLVALTLTPALCATLLRPHRKPDQVSADTTGHHHTGRVSRLMSLLPRGYQHSLGYMLRRPLRFLLIYALLVGGVVWGYQRLPTAFIPGEDQGTIFVRYALPDGATYNRTADVVDTIERYFMEQETDTFSAIYTVSGFSFSGTGQNAGIAFVNLKDWAERTAPEHRAQAVARRATQALSNLRDARVFAMVPPPIDGLGDTSGFEFWLQEAQGRGLDHLNQQARQLVNSLDAAPEILYADGEGAELTPQLRVDIDQRKALALGLDLEDINDTLGQAWGSRYVNDYVHQGWVRKVIVQADAPWRSAPEDLQHWAVRGSNGEMTPFSAFSATRWDAAPAQLTRFNGLPAVQISGAGAQGISSGDVITQVEQQALAQGSTHFEWSGLSWQEKLSSGQAPMLYAVSVLFIFLCLAALYESWSIPLAVLMVIPVGLLGAVASANWLLMPQDIFFQVGVLTTIGLSAKNAILIVEFAEAGVRQGQPLLDAVISAARQRLRPIIMTSLAFGAGVIPLVLTTAPGAASQNAIGTSVLGGVISATLFVIFLVPLCYLVVVRLSRALRRLFAPSQPYTKESH